ncbi:hypothetical protein D3C72_1862040 [compost metagenome]
MQRPVVFQRTPVGAVGDGLDAQQRFRAGHAQQFAGQRVRRHGVDPPLRAYDAQPVLAAQQIVKRAVLQPRAMQARGQVRRHGGFHQQLQFPIDAAQPLERHDGIALGQRQRHGLLRRGRAQFLDQHLRADRAALARHFVREPQHRRHEVFVAFARRHESALPAYLVDQTVAHQIRQRLPHHDA